MTNNILAQHKEPVARNQVSLDKFISCNQGVENINMRTLVYGIGVNDADYSVTKYINGKQDICVYYSIWRTMLKRCYSDLSMKVNPTYRGCTVCDEWHSFIAFKAWMKNQEHAGKQLDKDILIIGNRVYSPKSCIFVSQQVNQLLNNNAAKMGEFPQGVSKRKEKYRAQLSIRGKVTNLGDFATVLEAEAAYVKSKTSEIIRTALEQTNKRLVKSLIMYANYMRINFECKAAMLCR